MPSENLHAPWTVPADFLCNHEDSEIPQIRVSGQEPRKRGGHS